MQTHTHIFFVTHKQEAREREQRKRERQEQERTQQDRIYGPQQGEPLPEVQHVRGAPGGCASSGHRGQASEHSPSRCSHRPGRRRWKAQQGGASSSGGSDDLSWDGHCFDGDLHAFTPLLRRAGSSGSSGGGSSGNSSSSSGSSSRRSTGVGRSSASAEAGRGCTGRLAGDDEAGKRSAAAHPLVGVPRGTGAADDGTGAPSADPAALASYAAPTGVHGQHAVPAEPGQAGAEQLPHTPTQAISQSLDDLADTLQQQGQQGQVGQGQEGRPAGHVVGLKFG